MIATIKPVGISFCKGKDRVIVSATSTNSAPTNAQATNSILCFGPTSFLAKCGATKPTKPIPPLTDTLELVLIQPQQRAEGCVPFQ